MTMIHPRTRTAFTTIAAIGVAAFTVTVITAANPAAAISPTPTPSPTPSPSPSANPFADLPWLPPPGQPGESSFGGLITGLINGWFANVAAVALKPLLDMLSASLLATPQVTSSERVFELWKASLVVANAAFILLATVGGIIVMTYQSVQTRYAA